MAIGHGNGLMTNDDICRKLEKTGPTDLRTFVFLTDTDFGPTKLQMDNLVNSGKLIYEGGKYALSEQFRLGMVGMNNEQNVEDKQEPAQEENEEVRAIGIEDRGSFGDESSRTPIESNPAIESGGMNEAGILDKEVEKPDADIQVRSSENKNISHEPEDNEVNEMGNVYNLSGNIRSESIIRQLDNGGINDIPQEVEEQAGEQEAVKVIKRATMELPVKKVRKTNAVPPKAKHTAIPQTGIFERLVLKFAHVLQYFAFLITSLADLFLAMFFYWSLGYDNASKVILATWGIVQTGSKIWAWSYNRKVIAVWCACLSVIASVSIFLAVIELQASNTVLNNSTATVTNQIDVRIATLEADRAAQVKRRDSLPVDYSTAIKAANLDISKIDEQLNKLIDKKESSSGSIEKVNTVEISLSAWSIFKQLTDIKWNDAARMFALVFILALSILLEMVIYATVPRNKGGLK